jgi:hypothetical protein
MEYVDGIRLFDLLRLLRQISEQDAKTATLANNAAVTLMERSLNRLSIIQNALMTWSIRPSLDPYPIKSHLTELMQIVRRLLCLPQLPSQALVELAEFEQIWVTKDAVVPFRDATPKNILIGIPELARAKHSDEVGRLASLRAWLKHGNPSTVRIVDYDFTSTEHLTAPEDDLISLLAHHGSLDVGQKILSHYNQPWHLALCNLPRDLGLPFSPDSERMARALIVRYFRFGGRKLLYRAVNPSGFAMRFQNDSPVYYFKVLPSLVSDLDPDFQRRWPELFSSLEDISMCISRLPAWNDIELEHDDFQRFSADGLTYWRESPVEFAKVGSL